MHRVHNGLIALTLPFAGCLANGDGNVNPEVPTAPANQSANAEPREPQYGMACVDALYSGYGAGRNLAHFDSPRELVLDMEFFPQGDMLVVGSGNRTVGRIRIWNVPDWALAREIDAHDAFVYSVAVSPDGEFIISSSFDESVKVWDAQTGELVRQLRGHDGPVRDLCFSPRGSIVATGGSDSVVRLWNVETGDVVGELEEGHEDVVRTVMYSLDGEELISGGEDGMLVCWDTETSGIRWKHSVGIPSVVGTAISADGNAVFAVDSDGFIRSWDLSSGMQISETRDRGRDAAAVERDSSGRTLAVCSYEEIHFYSAEELTFVGRISGNGNEARVYVARYSPDGRFLVAGGWSGRVRLWTLQ